MIRILNTPVPLRVVILGLSETLIVFTALLAAYKLAGEERGMWTPAACLQAALVAVIVLLSMFFVDLYEPQVTMQRAHGLSRLIQALGLTMLAVGVLRHKVLPLKVEPSTDLLGVLLVGAAIGASRCAFAELTSHQVLSEPAIIWGTSPLAAALIRELRTRPDIGIRVLGVVDDSYQGARFAGVEVLDSSSLAGPTLEGRQIRKVIVALGDRRGCLPVDTLVALTAAGVGVNDGSELYEQLTGKVWLGSFSLSSLVFAQTFRKPWITRCLNRAVSLLFAAIGLVIASPLLLALAALIRLESKGPAIFRQWRVGQNGRHFTLYKFRSMRVGSEIVSGTAPAAVDDPRCTRLGKWLRRFRLDELPQLLNILKGDMCFVGPRPFVPEQEKELTESIPHYRQRWMVRPGTTGWAQVHRGYNATVEDNIDKLSYDLFYIKHMSLGLDLVTIMKTAKVVLLGRGGR